MNILSLPDKIFELVYFHITYKPMYMLRAPIR